MFTGPLIDASVATWIAAPTQSRAEIIGTYCSPRPTIPPMPRRNAGNITFQGRLRRSITGALRRTHTRTPAADAGDAAACHCRVTLVMNASPVLGSDSVKGVSPRSPYHELPLPARNAG